MPDLGRHDKPSRNYRGGETPTPAERVACQRCGEPVGPQKTTRGSFLTCKDCYTLLTGKAWPVIRAQCGGQHRFDEMLAGSRIAVIVTIRRDCIVALREELDLTWNHIADLLNMSRPGAIYSYQTHLNPSHKNV